MKSFPTDPMRQHDRFTAALCQDWLEAGTVTRNTPRADAVRQISRQINETSRGADVSNKAFANNHGE